MKVKDLIEKLQKFDPELPVMVDGYEGGIGELKEPREVIAVLNYYKILNHFGPHQEGDPALFELDPGDYDNFVKVKAILLPR